MTKMTDCTVHEEKGFRLTVHRAPDGICEGTVVDIDVDPGTEVISFRNAEHVELNDVMKQFPDVKELRLGEKVKEVHISNFMFPNVRKVYSSSWRFADDSEFLIGEGVLYNTFCRTETESPGYLPIIALENRAVEGFRAKITGIYTCTEIRKDSCRGSMQSLEPPEYDTAMCIDSTVISLENCDGDTIIIPDAAEGFADNVKFPTRECTISVNQKSLKAFVIWSCEAVRKSKFCPVNLHIRVTDIIKLDEDLSIFEYRGMPVKNVVIDENQMCRSIDGILYFGQALYYCPDYRTEKVVIPEGIYSIQSSAFVNCRISEVVIPESMKIIGNSAFQGCKNIRQIDLRNVTWVGKYCFCDCTGLRSVRFGPAFQEIRSYAFKRCTALEEVTLPKSLYAMGEHVFDGSSVRKIRIENDRFPIMFFSGICVRDRENTEIMEVDLFSGMKFFAPKYMKPASREDMDDLCLRYRSEDPSPMYRVMNSLYTKAASLNVKCRCAVKAYRETHDEETAKYLARMGTKAVNSIIDDESDVLELLSTDILGSTAVKKALPAIREHGYVQAEAYILSHYGTTAKSFTL